jgi:hypothetical protein
MTTSISGTGGITFPDGSVQPAAASPYTLKNKIINGSMIIDQRNAGAAITATGLPVDRWNFYKDTAGGSLSVQRSSTAPSGFINSLGLTVTTSITPAAGEGNTFMQPIEGLNISDLDWGTANAKTVTLSFWVRSSLTGTFGGSITNSANNRSYPFTYTISAANTFEYKTVTIAGDTSGTWLTTNGVGMRIWFGLGVGSTLSGTAGSWSGATYLSATGATSVVGTNGATWYITGVQLEQNTSATPFERRLYGQELANCQRYFAKLQNDGTGQIAISAGFQTSTTVAAFAINFPVTMRAEPTVTVSNLQASDNVNFSNAWTLGSVDMGYNTGYLNGTISAAGAQFRPSFLFTANNTSGFLTLSAEL